MFALPRQVLWSLVLICAAAYVVVFVMVAPPLLQDLPNHLARVTVLDDLTLHEGLRFGRVFEYQFMLVPYVLLDLLWVAAIELLGARVGTAFIIALVLLSIPASLAVYMRHARVEAELQAPILIASLYLATGAYFLWGFLAFSLAVALIIVTLTAAQRFRKSASFLRYTLYLALVICGYLTHLAALVFTAAAIGVSGLFRLRWRDTTVLREALLLGPIGALGVWFGIASRIYRIPGDAASSEYSWGTVALKLSGLFWPIRRYDQTLDLLLLGTFGLSLLLLFAGSRASRSGVERRRTIEMLALGGTFLAVYFVMPDSLSEAAHVDVRALAPVALCALIVIAQLRPGVNQLSSRRFRLAALAASIALAVGNLGAIGLRLHRLDTWLIGYRAALAAVPEGSHVLSVDTRVREGMIRPELHSGSFLITDRSAVMPYLFSAEQGHPMKFFRYAKRPYAPNETWYFEHEPVDWRGVACTYQYIVVTHPYDAQRIRLPTSTKLDNGVAAVLAVAPEACTRYTQARNDQ